MSICPANDNQKTLDWLKRNQATLEVILLQWEKKVNRQLDIMLLAEGQLYHKHLQTYIKLEKILTNTRKLLARIKDAVKQFNKDFDVDEEIANRNSIIELEEIRDILAVFITSTNVKEGELSEGVY